MLRQRHTTGFRTRPRNAIAGPHNDDKPSPYLIAPQYLALASRTCTYFRSTWFRFIRRKCTKIAIMPARMAAPLLGPVGLDNRGFSNFQSPRGSPSSC